MSPSTSISAAQSLITSATRILALCGAGLSASSGLPTFRGAGGLWRNHVSQQLATPEAFEEDPALVWLFYAWRRHMSLRAAPNPAHHALAALARHKPPSGKNGFLCLTQNVDGLSPRAGHPEDQLRLLHGDILTLRCADEECGYIQPGNTDDPLCEALAAAAEDDPSGRPIPILDANRPLPEIKVAELPHCPKCKTSLLRPGVVWFGEALDAEMMSHIDDWISDGGKIDVILVVGTSAVVQPAASYVKMAQRQGARVMVFNPDEDAGRGLRKKDFFFQGDAAHFLPLVCEGTVGKLAADGKSFEEATTVGS